MPCSPVRSPSRRPPTRSDARSSGSSPQSAEWARRVSCLRTADCGLELVTSRRRLLRAAAASANLGPGFDVLAAALSLYLEVEVSEDGRFSVDTGGAALPADRSNLCVRAFEELHPADGLRFAIRGEVPLARGLGSSAAAIVAGLVAADHLFELGLGRDDVYA